MRRPASLAWRGARTPRRRRRGRPRTESPYLRQSRATGPGVPARLQGARGPPRVRRGSGASPRARSAARRFEGEAASSQLAGAEASRVGELRHGAGGQAERRRLRALRGPRRPLRSAGRRCDRRLFRRAARFFAGREAARLSISSDFERSWSIRRSRSRESLVASVSILRRVSRSCAHEPATASRCRIEAGVRVEYRELHRWAAGWRAARTGRGYRRGSPASSRRASTRRRFAIDARRRTAGEGDGAFDEQRTAAGRDELASTDARSAPCAMTSRPRRAAEHKYQRVNNERFARAGLSGEHVQPVAGLDDYRAGDGEIPDRPAVQARGLMALDICTSSFSARSE